MIFRIFPGPLLVLSMTSVVASYYLTFYRTLGCCKSEDFSDGIAADLCDPWHCQTLPIRSWLERPGQSRKKQDLILMAAPMLLISGILVFAFLISSLGVRMVWMVVTYNLFAAIANQSYSTSTI